MSMMKRIRDVMRSRLAGSSAISGPGDVERVIAELDAGMIEATRELVSYKAEEKLMAARSAELEAEIATWEQRARDAVLAGEDDLARTALAEKQRLVTERVGVERDRAEQGALAKDLLESRRELDKRLTMLKLRKGTLETQLAAARSGGASPLTDETAFDRLADAERQLDSDAIFAELTMDEIPKDELAQSKLPRMAGKDELAALKEKMKGEPKP